MVWVNLWENWDTISKKPLLKIRRFWSKLLIHTNARTSFRGNLETRLCDVSIIVWCHGLDILPLHSHRTIYSKADSEMIQTYSQWFLKRGSGVCGHKWGQCSRPLRFWFILQWLIHCVRTSETASILKANLTGPGALVTFEGNLDGLKNMAWQGKCTPKRHVSQCTNTI